MAVLSLRTIAALAFGVGISAALERRREPAVEPCCEQPAGAASCC